MTEYPELDVLADSLPDHLAVELRLALADLARLRGHTERLVVAAEGVLAAPTSLALDRLEEAVGIVVGPRARAGARGMVRAWADADARGAAAPSAPPGAAGRMTGA